MWYLVVYLMSSGYGNSSAAMTTIPEKYPDLAQCQNAGMKAEPLLRFSCVKAPEVASSIPQNVPQYDKDGNLKVTPGYFCGEYPDKCKIIDNMPKCVFIPNSGKLECN